MADEFDAEVLRSVTSQGRIQWHQHAFERLLERGITRAEVIEVYPADRPYPSCLILHTAAAPLHVVAAADVEARICHVITAYRPDLDHFESDWKTRKKESS